MKFLNKEELINNISNNLREKIACEDEAIMKIIDNLKIYFKSDTAIKLLLVGPSGVGKTSSVKIISDTLKNKLIRLDMSEYNLETSVNKLIGVSHGYIGYEDDYIFNKVKYNPYSIILVDEIEKAHPSVLNLFLQIMDEGFIHDSHGEKIDFSHTLIFMTSNACKNNSIGFGEIKNNDLSETFTEEFLGRFDDIITFDSLTKKDTISYLEKHLEVKDVDYEEILKELKYEKYGFRYINKIINKYNSKINI